METRSKSDEVYHGHIFKVTKDEVVIKGKIRQRDIVHHNGGVGILALQDHKILFVKQYRYAVSQYTLEIPAGKLEANEEPYASGLRELEEESGYTTDELHTLCSMYSTPGFCNEKLYLYWTEHLIKVDEPLPMDEDEEIEIFWYDVDDALQMIETGEIIDAKTIVAVQFAKLHMQRNNT